MAITVMQLVAKVTADTKDAETSLASMAKLTSPTGIVAMGALAVGAGIAAIGVTAVKMAGDFQSGMTSLVTGAGESQKNIGMVSQGILKMAVDTGTSTKQLSDGMFNIESAGYHGKAGLDALRAAAMGAKVGNADLATVADAETTVMVDYAAQHVNATQAVNGLIATVANGKTHMQDLASAMSSVLPTAAGYKVGLNDVEGALATMTAAGVPAADAATYLRQTIIGLGSPTAGAAKALKEVGLTTDEVNASMKKSLPATLAMITDAVGKKFPEGSTAYNEAIKSIAGGSKQMQGMLDLTGTHLKTFQGDVGTISDAVKKGGTQIVGWSDVQKDMNFQMDRAKAVAETLMISLGTKLLPAATATFGWIADNAIPTITKMVSWLTGTSQSAQIVRPILIALGIAIAGALVGAFVAWAIAAGAAAIATIAATWPVLAIGAGIALLIAGVILLVTHWKQISAAFADSGFGKVVLAVVQNIVGQFQALMGILGKVAGAIGNVFGGVGKALGSIHIPGFAGGTDSAPGGLALVGEHGPELMNLPRGTSITPLPSGLGSGAGAGSSAGAFAGGSQTIIVQLDGRTITQAVVKHLPTQIRLATGARAF